MATLKELMAQQSAESQERIAAKVDVMRRIVALNQLREAVFRRQNAGNGGKTTHCGENRTAGKRPLSTLKRYVSALGGELSIDVTLPNGKRIAFEFDTARSKPGCGLVPSPALSLTERAKNGLLFA